MVRAAERLPEKPQRGHPVMDWPRLEKEVARGLQPLVILTEGYILTPSGSMKSERPMASLTRLRTVEDTS